MQKNKTGGATLTAADVRVDMEVRTISGIDKDQLHDKLCVITHVNEASLWVKLKEGPLSGTPLKRSYKQIRIPEQNTLGATPDTLPAGAKKRPIEASAENEAAGAAKHLKESKALAIFSKHGGETEEPM